MKTFSNIFLGYLYVVCIFYKMEQEDINVTKTEEEVNHELGNQNQINSSSEENIVATSIASKNANKIEDYYKRKYAWTIRVAPHPTHNGTENLIWWNWLRTESNTIKMNEVIYAACNHLIIKHHKHLQ